MKTRGLLCLLFYCYALLQGALSPAAADYFSAKTTGSAEPVVMDVQARAPLLMPSQQGLSAVELLAYGGLVVLVAVLGGAAWWYSREQFAQQVAQNRADYQQQTTHLVAQLGQQRLELSMAQQRLALAQERYEQQVRDLQQTLGSRKAELDRMVQELERVGQQRAERFGALEKLCNELTLRQGVQFNAARDQIDRSMSAWRSEKDAITTQQSEILAKMLAEHGRITESMVQQVILFNSEKARANKETRRLKDTCWQDVQDMVNTWHLKEEIPMIRPIHDSDRPESTK